jgi:hypothetical protein
MFREKIKKYPKAYDAWVTYNQAKYGTAPSKDAYWLLMVGSLYDFFDRKGIYIIVNRSPADREFFWSIDIDVDYYDGDYTATRTEAEEQAFIKAFEILEDKL